jgi:hypothetical protein
MTSAKFQLCDVIIVHNCPHSLVKIFGVKLGPGIQDPSSLFSSSVCGCTRWEKFLFANENKLVQNSWPSPIKKLFGPNSLINKTGEQHK